MPFGRGGHFRLVLLQNIASIKTRYLYDIPQKYLSTKMTAIEPNRLRPKAEIFKEYAKELKEREKAL